MRENMTKNKIDFHSKAVVRFCCIAVLAILLLSISAVPFVFQTTTLWYKVGADRVLLFTGQLFGLYAAFLIFLQLVLISRASILTKNFGAAKLGKLHQLNGMLILGFGFAHILLMLLPEGLSNLPIGMKFWPEMVGAFLFLVLILLRLSIILRGNKIISYQIWSRLHRGLGFMAVMGITVHIAFVSDSFDNVYLLLALCALPVGALLIFVKGRFFRGK